MGFLVQANPRKSEQEPVVWGPHVAECVMRGARLQWPYAGSCDFLWDVQAMFQHYVMVPWVSPFPEASPLTPPCGWLKLDAERLRRVQLQITMSVALYHEQGQHRC